MIEVMGPSEGAKVKIVDDVRAGVSLLVGLCRSGF